MIKKLLDNLPHPLAMAVFSLVVVLDQVSKQLVASKMHPGDSIPVIRNVFHITLAQNRGVAFGLFQHRGSTFIFLGLIAIIVLLRYYREFASGNRLLQVNFAMLLGGAIGNQLDRIRIGYVVDFFDFRIWPVFNVADMGICIGVALILFETLWDRSDKTDETVAGKADESQSQTMTDLKKPNAPDVQSSDGEMVN